jgi:peptide/nickel transport system ATP-binding protein
MTALNPVRPVGLQITEPLVRVHGWSRARARARAAELLEQVRIREPAAVLRRYPHELSGGMRQRVLIAAAFAAEPRLIVADEPTTALDVTVQKEILRLIRRLRDETGTAVLFVTHNMGVVAQVSQRVTVLFGGRVIEEAATPDLFGPAGPSHAYTRALIAATPDHLDPAPEFRPVPPEIVAAMGEGR